MYMVLSLLVTKKITKIVLNGAAQYGQSGQIAQNGLAKLKVSFTTFTLNFGSTFSDCDILEKNPISLGRGSVKKLHLYRSSSVGYVKMMMTFR